MKPGSNGVRSQSADEMLNDTTPLRELLEIGGKDSSGKTTFLVSMLRFLELFRPEAHGFVIDSEKKFRSILKSFGADAPRNFTYYPVDGMGEAISSLDDVMAKRNPGDWVMVESASRLWEFAQGYGYETLAGVTKKEYLDARVGDKMPTGIVKKNSPIPFPSTEDMDRKFWPMVKNAHDGQFFNRLTEPEDLNVIFTTTIARPKKEDQNSKVKESPDRKALRVELGIDANLEGAPRLPYFPETLCLFHLERGQFTCQVLRDNLSQSDNSRTTFTITDKKLGGTAFEYWCRGSEEAKALLIGSGALVEE